MFDRGVYKGYRENQRNCEIIWGRVRERGTITQAFASRRADSEIRGNGTELVCLHL